ncbi:hypothetical protein AX16_001178 [Volvariella volvacea WC 439]|nr:hypothetical protein AX16_001178 [Volvariella volvacea WC 439]
MSMNAVCFRAPGDLEVISAPIPQVADDQVLIKITCCGVCGTDLHIAKGEFIAQFPLIPGHEFVGRIAKLGKDVVGFEVGDRVVADPTIFCDSCFFCRRGQHLFCEKFTGLGVNLAGGFAEYAVVQSKKVYKVHNLTDEEATLIEPAACALHGLDKLELSVGAEVLVLGAGPTGLILAQLLKLNGASKVVIAANKGIKTKIAQDLDAGDEYVELDRSDPSKQWEKLKSDYPYGFDVVVGVALSEYEESMNG